MNVSTNNELQCTTALAALEQVLDPEIGLNIVDLGLLYELHFIDAVPEMEVKMTLTTEFCPMGESIVDATRKALESTFSNYKITITLVFDPPWSYERISDRGRKFLER